MKKGLLALIVIVVLAVTAIAAPYVTGLLVERQIRDGVKTVNEMYGKMGTGVHLEVVKYNRGYNSADVETKVDLGQFASMYGGVQTFVVKSHLVQGMTGVESTSNLMDFPPYAQFVKTRLGGKDPLHLTEHYSPLGTFTSHITVDPFSLVQNGTSIKVQPAELDVTATDSMRHFSSKGQVQGVSYGDKFTLENISLESDQTMFTPFLWAGSANVTIKNGHGVGKEPYDFNDAAFKVVSSYDKGMDLYSIAETFAVEHFNVTAKTVDQARFTLGLKNVHGLAVEDFMKQYMELAKKMYAASAAGGTKEEQDARIKQQMAMFSQPLLAAAEKLLTKGMTIQLTDVHAKLPGGEINGNLELGLQKDMTWTQFMPLVGQPNLVVDIFTLKSNCTLPKALVGNNPRLTGQLFPGMQTGLFVNKDDMLEHQAEIKDHQLLLNGQPVNLQSLVAH